MPAPPKASLLLSLLLSGCVTSTTELRDQPPMTVDSARSEVELVRCFVETMAGFGTPVILPHSISFVHDSSTVLLIDVEPREGGTRLTIRRLTFRNIPAEVRRCL